MEAIVSDTTALIVLANLHQLDLFGACFEPVLIPDAVHREWLAGDATVDEAIQRLGFIQVVSVNDSALLSELQSLLDPGEAEALVVARERGLTLLVNEKKGERGVSSTSSLSVLFRPFFR